MHRPVLPLILALGFPVFVRPSGHRPGNDQEESPPPTDRQAGTSSAGNPGPRRFSSRSRRLRDAALWDGTDRPVNLDQALAEVRVIARGPEILRAGFQITPDLIRRQLGVL